MKVAFDISPTSTGHQVRGIGSYTKNLYEEFKKNRENVSFEFFNNNNVPDCDVVHYPYFDLFFKSLPSKSKAKRIVTIHDVIPLVFPNYFPVGIKGSVNLFFQKRSLKNTNAVICDSKTSKKDIVEKLSFPKDKVHVIYLAPSKIFKKLKNSTLKITQKYNIPEKFVLYVGDVNWNKNLINLLTAIKLSKSNLVMVGKALTEKNLPQTQEIDRLIKKLNIEKNVIKTGYISDEELAQIYNLAQATLQPSFYEGFGLPLLESMACGTPVISSNLASLAEISGDLSLVCDPTNPEDIAKQIENLLKLDAAKTQELSQKLTKHAAKFTWEKVALHTIEVYQKVYESN